MNSSLENKIYNTFSNLLDIVLSLKVKPDFKVRVVNEITSDFIDHLINNYGIKGVILDVDETIRFNSGPITYENKEWIEILKSKLKVIVVSNGVDNEVREYFSSLGIEYIGFANKPFKYNFKKACNILSLKPEEVVVIGDDLLCDIYGGKRNKMKTIMIRNKI